MATALKILGQSAPAAVTPTTIYTVPALTQTVISSLYAANRGATATTIRISVIPSGQTTANQYYLYYDVQIPANDTLSVVSGITLNAGDYIEVYATDAQVTFQTFGQENS